MHIGADEPDRFPTHCPVCGKVGVVMPSYPIGDGCCPHCGSLVLVKRRSPASIATTPIKMLPDTAENRKEAEATVAEQLKIWEEMKDRKPAGPPSTSS
jgi:DNA-directed RNA polymerase subunit RPC12/RpoP